MLCLDKQRRNKNDISKLMTTVNAIKELREFALIDAADKQKQFYLGKPTSCKPARILSNIQAISRCPSGRFEPIKMDDYSLLVMKYGGQDLAQFGDEVRTWTKTKEHVDAIELFWLEAVRLFYGLKVLHDNNVLHHDIKQQNIVYNKETNRVNFIDFGFMEKRSVRISTAKRSVNWLGNNHHWSFPLEAVYWNKDIYMLAASARGKSKKAYREFAESVADNCGYFFTSVLNFNSEAKRDNATMMIAKGAYKNVLAFEPTDEAYTQFVEKSIDSVDTYGLGIALTFMLHRSKHLLDKEFYTNLKNIVMNMFTGGVFIRSTPEQLLAQYEDILANSGLLEKHNKHIENHLIANGVSTEMKVAAEIANSTDMLSIPRMAVATGATEIVRECPAGKEFNPLTKRCINICKPGYVRNPSFKCVSSKRLAKTIKSSIQSIPKNTSVRSLHSLSLKMTKSMSPQKTKSMSPQKTKSMSPQKTKSISPQKTKSISPQKTRSLPPQKTRSLPPQKTRSLPPQKTRSLSLKKTRSMSPQKTRSVSLKNTKSIPKYTNMDSLDSLSLKMTKSMSPQMTKSMSPQMTRSFPQQMTTSFPQQMTRSFPQQMTKSMSPQMTRSFPQQMTRSMSPQMTRSMSPQMTRSFPQQMTRSMSPQMTRSFPQQMTRSMSPERAAFLSPQRTISIPKNTNVDSLD
jgi:serine/threonine protein kinase